MWTLVIELTDGTLVESPPVVPNNPEHDWDNIEVLKSIGNTGTSMVKRLHDVKSWRFGKK